MEKIDIANRIASLLVEINNEKYKALERKEKGIFQEFNDIEYNLIEDLNSMGFDFNYKYETIGFKLDEREKNKSSK